MSEATVHIPVLLHEVIEHLQPREGGVFVDGTLGGGGHTRALAQRVGEDGRVIAMDLDPEPVRRAERTLAGLPVSIATSSYTDIPEILDEVNIPAVDGILLD